jgi:hypothetical protein
MSVILSMNDPSYCESKAIELISEAKEIIRQNDYGLGDYSHKMNQAISLLAIAQAMRE